MIVPVLLQLIYLTVMPGAVGWDEMKRKRLSIDLSALSPYFIVGIVWGRTQWASWATNARCCYSNTVACIHQVYNFECKSRTTLL